MGEFAHEATLTLWLMMFGLISPLFARLKGAKILEYPTGQLVNLMCPIDREVTSINSVGCP